MNRNIALGVAGGALTLALVGGGIWADRTYAGASAPVVAQTAAATHVAMARTNANTSAKVRTVASTQAKAHAGMRGAARLGHLLIKATVDVTGLQAKDIYTQLHAGKSLAEIAQTKGKTADDVVKAARTTLQTRLDAAVKSGKTTQDHEAKALASFDKVAPTLVNDTKLATEMGVRHPSRAALIKATATVSGVQPKDVITELRAGKSLAQVAQEHGKTANDVIAAARTTVKTHLDAAVKSGKLTQAREDAMLAQFDKAAPTIVNATHTAKTKQQ